MSLHFLYGFALTSRLSVPLPGVILVLAPLMLGVAATLPASDDPVYVLTGVIILSAGQLMAGWALGRRAEVEALSAGVDRWHRYRRLEDQLEVRTHRLIASVSFFYFRGFLAMSLLVCNTSLTRTDWTRPSSLLMLPVWTPLDSWPAACLLQLYQTLAVTLSIFLYLRVTAYIVAATVLLGAQLRLAALALLTLEARVSAELGSRTFASLAERRLARHWETHAEITSCVVHYQNIFRCAKKLEEMSHLHANMSYYLAMWLWCMLGVQVVKEGFSLQSLVLLLASIGNTLALSLVAEIYDAAFEEVREAAHWPRWYEMPLASRKSLHLLQGMLLRRPGVRTSLGTRVCLENFARTVNGAYCYFSFLITVLSKAA